jgi:ribosome-associated translation inhibitor RaiA
MPDGVMEWFDPSTGTGRIAKGGRAYTADAVEVEPSARIPGARVHFDVDRRRPGEARNVTSRRGGRSRPRHHRVGDLSGARHPDAKGPAAADPFERPLIDRDVHPEKVAAAWTRHMTTGDVESAVALCAPNVVLHTGTCKKKGHAAISVELDAWPYTGAEIDPIDTSGEGDLGTIRMTWPGWGPDRTVVLHIEHGEITEAGIDGAPAEAPEAAAEPVAVEATATGLVTDWAKRYAVEKVQHIAADAVGPVLFARVKLRHLSDPAARRPALAEAMLDVNGRAVRAHTAAATMTEAIDELADRLWRRLDAVPHWSRTEGVPPAAGEWRHDNRPSPRVTWFERPPDERQLVRRKAVADEPLSIDEAVFDMDLLDYDFYLFNDLASGQDALVRRTGETQVDLFLLHPDDIEPPVSTTPVMIHPTAPPTLTAQQAEEWLDVTEEPLVFFTDIATGRGCVLYQRYDGHRGLVAPAV